jgi:hypothetical protein
VKHSGDPQSRACIGIQFGCLIWQALADNRGPDLASMTQPQVGQSLALKSPASGKQRPLSEQSVKETRPLPVQSRGGVHGKSRGKYRSAPMDREDAELRRGTELPCPEVPRSTRQ